MKAEEGAVIAAVLAGDTESFQNLLDRYRTRLMGVMMQLVKDEDLAQDLAQEAVMRALSHLKEYRGDASFGTWLVQIGVNLARDHLRRQAREHPGLPGDQPAPRAWDGPRSVPPGPAAPPGELRRHLLEAMGRLPPHYREILIRRYYQGQSFAEIAGATGESCGALRARALRARRQLGCELKRGAPQSCT
jgi:RNA polymerase sigma-70 factor (ECF subfamily)